MAGFRVDGSSFSYESSPNPVSVFFLRGEIMSDALKTSQKHPTNSNPSPSPQLSFCPYNPPPIEGFLLRQNLKLPGQCLGRASSRTQPLNSWTWRPGVDILRSTVQATGSQQQSSPGNSSNNSSLKPC